MKTTKIYHPKCKELFGTVKVFKQSDHPECKEFDSNPDGMIYESEDCMGYEDWHSDFDEAKKCIEDQNEYEYSGKGSEDRANERKYADQERFVCGNY